MSAPCCFIFMYVNRTHRFFCCVFTVLLLEQDSVELPFFQTTWRAHVLVLDCLEPWMKADIRVVSVDSNRCLDGAVAWWRLCWPWPHLLWVTASQLQGQNEFPLHALTSLWLFFGKEERFSSTVWKALTCSNIYVCLKRSHFEKRVDFLYWW